MRHFSLSLSLSVTCAFGSYLDFAYRRAVRAEQVVGWKDLVVKVCSSLLPTGKVSNAEQVVGWETFSLSSLVFLASSAYAIKDVECRAGRRTKRKASRQFPKQARVCVCCYDIAALFALRCRLVEVPAARAHEQLRSEKTCSGPAMPTPSSVSLLLSMDQPSIQTITLIQTTEIRAGTSLSSTTPLQHHSSPAPLLSSTTPLQHHSSPAPLLSSTTPLQHHSSPAPLQPDVLLYSPLLSSALPAHAQVHPKILS